MYHNDPYYASGFGASGFKQQFQDPSNQVRHFAGWFGAGFFSPSESYARNQLYDSEGTRDPAVPDVALGLAAIALASSFNGDYAALAQDVWHEICGGTTNLKF